MFEVSYSSLLFQSNSAPSSGGWGHVNLGTRVWHAAPNYDAAVAVGDLQPLGGWPQPWPPALRRRRAGCGACALRGHVLRRPVPGGEGRGGGEGERLCGCRGNQLTCGSPRGFLPANKEKWTTKLNKHLNNQPVTLIPRPLPLTLPHSLFTLLEELNMWFWGSRCEKLWTKEERKR